MLLKLIDSPEAPVKMLTRVMRGVGLMELLVVVAVGLIEEGSSMLTTSSFTRARDNDVP